MLSEVNLGGRVSAMPVAASAQVQKALERAAALAAQAAEEDAGVRVPQEEQVAAPLSKLDQEVAKKREKARPNIGVASLGQLCCWCRYRFSS